jgi:hypothetical protein
MGANMGCEFPVALQLEVAHHFIVRFTRGRIGSFESPATFGTTKTPETLLFNPYQLPTHGRLCLRPIAVRSPPGRLGVKERNADSP